MACYLEFPVFWRQTIVACPIESTDFTIFLALNDFLNVAKSYHNTLYHFDNKGQFGTEVVWIYCFNNTILVKVGNS